MTQQAELPFTQAQQPDNFPAGFFDGPVGAVMLRFADMVQRLPKNTLQVSSLRQEFADRISQKPMEDWQAFQNMNVNQMPEIKGYQHGLYYVMSMDLLGLMDKEFIKKFPDQAWYEIYADTSDGRFCAMPLAYFFRHYKARENIPMRVWVNMPKDKWTALMHYALDKFWSEQCFLPFAKQLFSQTAWARAPRNLQMAMCVVRDSIQPDYSRKLREFFENENIRSYVDSARGKQKLLLLSNPNRQAQP